MIRIMLVKELHILHCLTMIWWLLGTYLRITACGHHTWSGVCARSDMDMSMCKHDSRREKHAANRGPGGPGAWVQSHKCWSWCSQFMSILGFVTSLSLCMCCVLLESCDFSILREACCRRWEKRVAISNLWTWRLPKVRSRGLVHDQSYSISGDLCMLCIQCQSEDFWGCLSALSPQQLNKFTLIFNSWLLNHAWHLSMVSC